MSKLDYVWFCTPPTGSKNKNSAEIGLVDSPDFKSIFERKNNKTRIFTKPEFAEFAKTVHFDFAHIKPVDQDGINYLMPVISNFADTMYIGLDAYKDFDLSPLESLKGVKTLDFEWNLKITKLWDLTKNTSLKVLRMTDYNKISDFSPLIGSGIEEVRLYGCNDLSSFTSKLHIADCNVFLQMPKLKILRLNIVKDQSDEYYLRLFSKLTNLEEILLPESFFTFEQFAWLSSKLPNVKGLEAYWHNECMGLYSIIGRRKPRFLYKKDIKRVKKYEQEYEELKSKYKDQADPPI